MSSAFENITALYKSPTTQVFRARRKSDNREVILKSAEKTTKPQISLSCEYELAKRIDSKFIVRPLNMDLIDEREALIFDDDNMSCVEQLIPRQGFSVADFINLSLSICYAVEDLHAGNVVHRNISPSNLISNKELNFVKLIDFKYATEAGIEIVKFTALTKILGTLNYIAPELTGRFYRVADHRVDLYSFGATLFEMATGQPPFKAECDEDLVQHHIETIAPNISDVNHSYPACISKIVSHLLEKEPLFRYQTIFQVRQDLEKLKAFYDVDKSFSNYDFSLPVNLAEPLLTCSNYGREKEAKAFHLAWEKCNNHAHTVCIHGAGGMGKSVLISAIYPEVNRNHGILVSSFFDQQENQKPYSVIVEVLNQLLDQLLNGRYEHLAWADLFSSALGDKSGVISSLVPLFKILFQADDRQIELKNDLSPKSISLLINDIFTTVLKQGVRVALVFENLQWADEDSLVIINSIIERQHKNLLLVLSSRHCDEKSSTQSVLDTATAYKNSITVINLEPLSIKSMDHWLSDRFNLAVNDKAKLIGQLLLHSRGNPLAVSLSLNSLIEETIQTSHCEAEFIVNDDVLDSLSTGDGYQQIVKKIQNINVDQFNTLCDLSILGFSFKIDDAELLYDMECSREDIQLSLAALCKQHLLIRSGNEFRYSNNYVQLAAKKFLQPQQALKLNKSVSTRLIKECLPEVPLTLDRAVWFLNCTSESMTDTELLAASRLNHSLALSYRPLAAYQCAEYHLRTASDLYRSIYDPAVQDEDYESTLNCDFAEVLALNGRLNETESQFSLLINNCDDVDIQARVLRQYNDILLKNSRNLQVQIGQQRQEISNTRQELSFVKDHLADSQVMLRESEKMAALGSLVAGVTHEINTPIGICITGMTHFIDRTKQIKREYYAQSMRQEDLEKYFDSSSKAAEITFKNLLRATDLIRSFKRISADQSTGLERRFYFLEYIREVLVSLSSQYRKRNISVNLVERDDFQIKSHPGWFSQIITNMIMNSLIHAYGDTDSGCIDIDTWLDDEFLVIQYQDDGKGIDKDKQDKIFDAFYTTNSEGGGTGLGLSVISDIVKESLGGNVLCESELGHGVKFTMKIPREKIDLNKNILI